MIDSQDIIFGEAGQKLVFDVPGTLPTAVASVAVFADSQDDTGTPEAATSGAPAVEAVSAELDDAAGAGEVDPTAIPLVSVAGLVRGRRYLLIGARGQRETVELAQVDETSAAAYARSPLRHDYAAGDVLYSTRLEVAIDAGWVATQAKLSHPFCPSPKYRAKWVYTADGETRAGYGWFDVVLTSELYTVTTVDVEARFPGWLYRLPTDQQQDAGERVIREAMRDVGRDLLEHGVADWAQRNSPTINTLVLYKARLIAHEMNYDHGGQNEAQLERARVEYERRFNLIRHPKANQQVSQGGAGGIAPAVPAIRR